MFTFTVVQLSEFQTQQPVYKLLRDEKDLLQPFLDYIAKNNNFAKEFKRLYTIVAYVANNSKPPLPQTHYRKLQLSSDEQYEAYEAKSKHLRLYWFHQPKTSLILVFGGTKNSQKKDLARLQVVMNQFSTFNPEENNHDF